jgi:RNA polymerase sigma factor (sigma-70 family)
MGNSEKNISKHSDEKLMALVCNRNTHALKLLYDRHSHGVYNFILKYTNNRELSEDVLQETFIRVWFAAHTFNNEKGRFKTWLFKIGINITRSEMIKKRYDYQYVPLDDPDLDCKTGGNTRIESAEDLMGYEELKDSVNKALERLNPFFREVIILKHYQKMKFSEISEITNTPEGTLKARFHRALGQLRILLQGMRS